MRPRIRVCCGVYNADKSKHTQFRNPTILGKESQHAQSLSVTSPRGPSSGMCQDSESLCLDADFHAVDFPTMDEIGIQTK